MLNPKRQCFGHLMQRADSLKKTPMLKKIEGKNVLVIFICLPEPNESQYNN